MEGLEKNNFDKNWKEALKGAEVSPSEGVWGNVEQKLDRKAMKKRLIFYQRLAAACVLFALVAASFGVYYWNENNRQLANVMQAKNNLKDELKNTKCDSAQQKKENEQTVLNENDETKSNAPLSVKEKTERKQIAERLSQKPENDLKQLIGNANNNSSLSEKKNSSSDNALVPNAEQIQSRGKLNQSTENELSKSNVVADKNLLATREEENTSSNRLEQSLNNNDVDENTSLNQNKILSSNKNQSSTSKQLLEKENSDRKIFTANLSVPEPGLLPIDSIKSELVYVEIKHKLPVFADAFLNIDKKEKMDYEKMWIAVTASEGSYAVNYRSSYPSSTSSYTASTSNSSKALTYTVGVLGGVRFTDRWILQAGLQYINQSSSYASNVYASSLGAVASTSQYYTVSGASPYGITSTSEFVSVPVQAGYLLLNGKFGVQINSGIASNFFVRNTLSDPSGKRKSYSQGPGENSPYHLVNVNGLLNTEISYRLGKNYRLSFVPGLGYSLSPVAKTQTTNNPLSWDVGLRFRYIFK